MRIIRRSRIQFGSLHCWREIVHRYSRSYVNQIMISVYVKATGSILSYII